MFNKVKIALYSVVNGIDPIPSITDGETRTDEKAPKYPYTRPHFLLFQTDEVQVSADHQIRPIIVPRDISKLPWNSGYAETVNAGKSKWNEDQACVWKNVLVRESERHLPSAGLPYIYFALFDGHAGHGAAVAAANQLHEIVHAKLLEVYDHILPPMLDEPEPATWKDRSTWIPSKAPTSDDFIVGALESSFNEMDKLIGEDKKRYTMSGGCTALVALFIRGKLYVANAGDSRAIRCKSGQPFPMSNDFTPCTEKARLQQLAACRPELLMNNFTHLEYTQKFSQSDLGRRVVYRNAYMSGWAYKTCCVEDLRVPVVAGEGKRSRLLATIGVTRGLGDHELCSIVNKTPIKPFLSSQAEVQIFDIASATDLTENDVLVMGTDGLWDVTNNEKTATIVENTLSHFPRSDDTRFKYRYASAAQDLVQHSRGKPLGRYWQTAERSPATIDDISVFVIPLLPYQKEDEEWLIQYFDEVCRQRGSQEKMSDTSPPTETVGAQVPSVVPSSPTANPVSAYPSIIVPTRASTIAPPTVCLIPAAAPVDEVANSTPPLTTSMTNAISSTSEDSKTDPSRGVDQELFSSLSNEARSQSVTCGMSEIINLPNQLPITQSATSTSHVNSSVVADSASSNAELLRTEMESKLNLSTLVDEKTEEPVSSTDLVDVHLSPGPRSPADPSGDDSELSDGEDWDESSSGQ